MATMSEEAISSSSTIFHTSSGSNGDVRHVLSWTCTTRRSSSSESALKKSPSGLRLIHKKNVGVEDDDKTTTTSKDDDASSSLSSPTLVSPHAPGAAPNFSEAAFGNTQKRPVSAFSTNNNNTNHDKPRGGGLELLSQLAGAVEDAGEQQLSRLAAEERRKQRKRVMRRQEPEHKVYVTAIRDQDVLFGRGSRTGAHPGNQAYLKFKDMIQHRYLGAARAEKKAISQELLDFVHHRGGRFLKQEVGCAIDEDLWYEVLDSTARDKASQALREINTPEVRQKKRARYANKPPQEKPVSAEVDPAAAAHQFVHSRLAAQDARQQQPPPPKKNQALSASRDLLEIPPTVSSSSSLPPIKGIKLEPQEAPKMSTPSIVDSNNSSSSTPTKPKWLLEIPASDDSAQKASSLLQSMGANLEPQQASKGGAAVVGDNNSRKHKWLLEICDGEPSGATAEPSSAAAAAPLLSSLATRRLSPPSSSSSWTVTNNSLQTPERAAALLFSSPQQQQPQVLAAPPGFQKQIVYGAPPPPPATAATPDHGVSNSSSNNKTTTNNKRNTVRQLEPEHKKTYVLDEYVRDADVLLGRGGRSTNHPGNKAYLNRKDELQARYKVAPRQEKKTISRSLLAFVHNRGGRFLKQEESRQGVWYEVPDAWARNKASQALRDINTPEARLSKRARYAK